jgi:phosphohistidine phosphatase SixA
MSRRGLGGFAAAVAALALPATASGTPSLEPRIGQQLRTGGVVLVFRHAVTDQSKQDESPVDLTDCTTQRNLSAQGRADARTIGRQVRRLKLRIGAVLASPFCRTLETARLAFGGATATRTLLNTIVATHDARWRSQIAGVRRLMGTTPAAGTVTVLVTHGSVVGDATGLALEEGEGLVFRPQGRSRFRLIGRILPAEWSRLRVTVG